MQYYCNRTRLKQSLSLPATATGSHALLDFAIERVSRDIDKAAGFQFYPSSGVRYYRPTDSMALRLDYPLLSVDSVTLDTDGDSSYESTLEASAYYTTPDNASVESPPQPFWGLEVREGSNTSCVFPVGVQRGARVQGTWGYFDSREETTAKPATGVTAVATLIKFTGASALHAGMSIRVDSEQMLVVANGLSGSDTATTSGQVTVRRAMNGSVGATHSSNSTLSVYTYPVIDQAALWQAQQNYRALDAPLGSVAGDLSGGQPLRSAAGLHPFVGRVIDQFRELVAR